MTAPAVQGSAAGNGIATAADPWSVNLPASIANGERVIIFMRASAATFTLPVSGWTTLISNEASDASDDASAIIYRECDGSEGATLSVDLSASAKGITHSYRISGHDPGTAPVVSTVAVGTTATPNPGSVNMGVSDDYLFFVWGAMDGETQTITTYPTNYVSGQDFRNSGTGGVAASNNRSGAAYRTATTTSEDPGVFTYSAAATTGWTAFTVGIAPAAAVAVVPKPGVVLQAVPRSWSY